MTAGHEGSLIERSFPLVRRVRPREVEQSERSATMTWGTELAADPEAPSDARVFLRSVLAERAAEERVDTVTLLASELVSNAVVHGSRRRGSTIRLHTEVRDERLRVEVTDSGPGFDPSEALSRRGFGLRLVRDLSARWGAEQAPSGWTVWFEL
jgi:anti-sigma regulatory factor (Ser/Thr protein kinase)